MANQATLLGLVIMVASLASAMAQKTDELSDSVIALCLLIFVLAIILLVLIYLIGKMMTKEQSRQDRHNEVFERHELRMLRQSGVDFEGEIVRPVTSDPPGPEEEEVVKHKSEPFQVTKSLESQHKDDNSSRSQMSESDDFKPMRNIVLSPIQATTRIEPSPRHAFITTEPTTFSPVKPTNDDVVSGQMKSDDLPVVEDNSFDSQPIESLVGQDDKVTSELSESLSESRSTLSELGSSVRGSNNR